MATAMMDFPQKIWSRLCLDSQALKINTPNMTGVKRGLDKSQIAGVMLDIVR
ncbi:hypothetical protein Dd586_3967 [Dickeya parazeae Ech586]|uniref:Uncharacterized protein n=1 Tax=Dickeya zeae (strain Ech586) TaxID=590409 RepID=D2BYY9_DICZ5|nr:hypothetical protein Dd586_3967 [Dickeya parazeae Ech586]